MGTVVELDAMPGARSLYRRAAFTLLTRRHGDRLPERTLVHGGVAIDRDRLARYDRVCGFDVSDVLPGTYPHILAFPLAMALMSGPDFPFPVAGLVHLANRIEVIRPVRAHERLRLAVRAADLRPHERGRQFDIQATAWVNGAVVWRGTSTYLRRQARASGGRGPRDTGRPVAAAALWRVGREIGRRYAQVSGDRNPIHTSRLVARAFGFPRPVAHGMWSTARCLALLAPRLPEAYTVEVAFKLPILLPATVSCTVVAADGGWSVALHDARTGRPHLVGAMFAG